MSDFAFQITGDASKANAAIGTVMDRLEAIKRKAAEAAATPGLDKMAAGFAKLGEAIRKEQQALARTTQIHQQLTAAANPAAQAFGKMAEAIGREQAMLEKIHGPTKQHIQDLQTLDALLKRGAISAKEHAAASGQGVTARQPFQAGGMMRGAMGAAAAVGVGLGAREIVGFADEYTNIQNRLRAMAPDQAHANKLFADLQGIAQRSRADLSATVDAFAGMSRATKSLGLSQSETLRVTETLNKLVTISGKSATESAAGLMQFSQALSSGRLQGDELRSVFENMPTLVDALTSSLGVSQAQLREMGSEGLITSKVMIEALQKAGDSVDGSFNKSIPTASQAMTQFKNEMITTFGQLNQSMNITGAISDALSALGTVIKVVAEAFGALAGALDAIGISGSTATKVLGAMGIAAYALGGSAGIIAGVSVAAVQGAEAIGDWQHEMNDARLVEEQLVISTAQVQAAMEEITFTTDEWGHAIVNVTAKLEDAKLSAAEFRSLFMAGDETSQFQKMMGGGFSEEDPLSGWIRKNSKAFDEAGAAASGLIAVREKSVTAATKELAALERQWDSYKHGALTVELYKQQKEQLLAVINGTTEAHGRDAKAAKKLADEYEKLAKALLGVESVSARAIRQGEADRAAFRAGVDGDVQREIDAERHALESRTTGAKSMEFMDPREQDMSDKVAEEQTKIAIEAEQAAQRTSEAWANAGGKIGRSFIDAALEGKKSFGEMTQAMLRDVAMLVLKMAALKLISGGGKGALAGQAMSGLLGFAHGGIIAEGRGGTDSQLVAFRKSPNERVTVETPEQQRTGSLMGGSMGGLTVVNQYQDDPRAIRESFSGREGDRVIHNSMRRRGRKR